MNLPLTNKYFLELPFEEAMQPVIFAEHLQKVSESTLREELAQAGNGLLKTAMQSASFVIEKGHLQVHFPNGIPKGAEMMGGNLPILVDGKTKQTIQVARISKTGKAVRVGASAALIIVQLSHVISGRDQVKYLREIEGKVDKLIHHHHASLHARLEGIYRHSKEIIMSVSDHELSQFDLLELSGMCRELIELRSQWRENFLHELSSIDKAAPGFFAKFSTSTKKESHKKSIQMRASDRNVR